MRYFFKAKPDAFIEVYQEGSKVQRLKNANGFNSYPSQSGR